MARFFRAAEVAIAAVEIERKGHDFYKRMAEKAAGKDAREFFEYFAGEEIRHRDLFQDLVNRLEPVELPAWSTVDEYADYLEALIDSHALFGGLTEKLMAEASDEETAVRLAMNFEKDTILFFNEMKELVPDSEKSLVRKCIEEERSHLKQLRARLKG